MISRMFLRCACALFFPLLASAAQAAPSDLWSAAAAGDVTAIRELAKKTKVDARDSSGQTALMHAARAAKFGAIRELLRLGADPAIATSDGRTALSLVNESADDARACQLIIRAYVFMKTQGRAPAARPARPHLVLVFEPTVNYLHPELKKHYYVNAAEAQGAAGADDDRNGFIDDVYGWNLDADRAHEINPLQFQMYLQSRDTITRLFARYNENKLGRLSDADYKATLSGFDNPLAQIFGRNAGFTNGDFLKLAMQLSHGSHVAGIIVEHSREKALLHTLSWQAFGDGAELSPTRPIGELARGARDVKDFLGRYRGELLKEALVTGRRLSDYVRASGAGVVNMSMGSDMKGFAQRAQQLASLYLMQGSGPRASISMKSSDTATLQRMLREMAFEYYAADAVQFMVAMFENPDVLFVIAAGNDGEDNDDSFQSPAYLSRFMANAITVAAVNEENEETAFSNFGRLSVDIGAPGVKICSTVIPEAHVLMDGTSMAAPAVAGAAAYVRAGRPEITAAELRKLIQYTSKTLKPLASRVSSGGILDSKALFALTGDAGAQARAYAAAASRATTADATAIPERLWDAEWLIERAVKLDPNSPSLWNSRGIVYSRRENPREAIASYTRAISLAEKSPSVPAASRATYHRNRAVHHLALGNTSAARADAEASRRLDPSAALSDKLKALLP